MSSKSLGKGLVIFIVVAILFAMGAANLSTAQAVPGSEDTAFSSASEKVDVLIGFYQAPGPSERTLVRAHGGEIYRQFTIVDVIAASMTPQAAESLAENPSVRYVEPDGPVYTLDQTVPWGIYRVFDDEEYGEDGFPTWKITRGDGIAVAILDTGIDENHEDLPALLGGVNTIDDTHWGSDGSGHGTHVAGTVAALDNEVGVVGVGPKLGLYAVKVLDDGGSGTWSSVAAGVEWAVEQGIPVLNMSLGGGDSQTMRDACDAAYSAGHLLVAAAGNSGNPSGRGDNVGYPAAYDSVIAVAASNDDDRRASFSSTGPAVELIAPGVDILSTVPGNGYEEKNGTSMASPHAAGAAALAWAANTGLTNVELRTILQKTAEELGLSANHQGHGLVRADLAVAEAKSLADEATEYEVVVVAPEDVEETAVGTHTYNFEIKNTGTENDTYGLTVDSDDEKFIASVQVVEVIVDAGATGNVNVDVEITDTVSPGDSAGITLTATSQTDSAVYDSDSMVVTLIGEPLVSTREASGVTDNSAILQGKLIDLGGTDAVEVWFEWAKTEDFNGAETTNKMTMGNTGYFEDTIDELEPSTTYYFRAMAKNEAGISEGVVKEFTTEEEKKLAEPEIIIFEVDTRTAGPWYRADVKWEVYHKDGALYEVKSELLVLDDEGEVLEVLDTVTTSVSGESASGEHNLRTRRGDADAVCLTVTDTEGQETTETKDAVW